MSKVWLAFWQSAWILFFIPSTTPKKGRERVVGMSKRLSTLAKTKYTAVIHFNPPIQLKNIVIYTAVSRLEKQEEDWLTVKIRFLFSHSQLGFAFHRITNNPPNDPTRSTKVGQQSTQSIFVSLSDAFFAHFPSFCNTQREFNLDTPERVRRSKH